MHWEMKSAFNSPCLGSNITYSGCNSARSVGKTTIATRPHENKTQLNRKTYQRPQIQLNRHFRPTKLPFLV
ncbi:hypothetical protein HanXRQr2_Chr08g0357161 [Helianthus annuus]|uniref:Uncharacterized protein n=1 Tax=Helianthus annuus TaxID=4232 RepID=A0A9K3IHJ3_HELAN|nr:hypothetical protein HanXRQr2_Chr08g0357161 [Helianthus annuus]KAJ0903079.1 hypothetical protein HanPSC8_Chr08g0344861 [Helianthus annuus]